ncbi:hypothetical protein ACPPVO_54070 [Dactylosporangium sp. McL0621]|uniref:hypothetical protein n=1 Tax=Dactylosporangium sp. McL0621 TaxID=3415678 RepID=UPI003CF35ABD
MDATTTTTSASPSRRHSPWLTAAWIGLLTLGGLYVFGATNDLIADARTGLPVDHTATFTAVTATSWSTAQHTDPGVTGYVTLLERGYALHELVFAFLFLIIVAVPFRRRQPWAWWACWIPTIANAGYTLSFGAHDTTILYRSLIALIGLPLLLLVHIPAFLTRHRQPQ